MYLSKRCNTCGATNFESATICINCGSLFKDGAYSPSVSKARKFKMPYKDAIRLEKSSKAIVAVIACIVAVIAIITIICVFALGGDKPTDDSENAEVAAVAQQQEVSDSGGNTVGTKSSANYDYSDSGSLEGFEVTKITASEKSIEMKAGETKRISVELTPDNSQSKHLKWYSDNEEIVRIAEETKDLECSIEAVGEGTATITVSFDSNGAEDSIIKETITITVVDANRLVEPERVADYGDYCVTANNFLALRTGPGTEYGEMARMNTGEIVRVLAMQINPSSDYWYYVDFNGTEGWAMGRFLEEYDGNE